MARSRTSDLLLRTVARHILDGRWPEGQKIPPVRELARMFGVARATMDAAIAKAARAGLLETRPRKAVLVADRAAVVAARLLSDTPSTRTVRLALLRPDRHEGQQTTEHDRVVSRVAEQAHQRGWQSEEVYWPLRRQAGFPRVLVDRGFNAAFCVVGNPERLMALHYMRQRDFPVVIYNRRFVDLPLPAVLFDEYGAVQRLGNLLHTMGHRRITLVSTVHSALQRMENPQINGWLDFCRQKDLLDAWADPLHLIGHPDTSRALRTFLQRTPRPTAIILATAELADAFCRLDDLGLRIPADFSVVAASFASESGAADAAVPITCMEPNLPRMAECSLELLARMLDGEPYPPPLRLPHILIRSDSIGPPPSE
jgi:DNA-binding LacI/PurR family transcriptional regulator